MTCELLELVGGKIDTSNPNFIFCPDGARIPRHLAQYHLRCEVPYRALECLGCHASVEDPNQALLLNPRKFPHAQTCSGGTLVFSKPTRRCCACR